MADKIVAEYDVRVDKALKDLDKLSKRVDKIDKDGQKSAKNVEQSYSKMASSLSADFKKLAGTIGIAFGTQQLLSFGKEAIRVAARAEGIEAAFRKLNRPDLLSNLRKATRGTVNDLTLMQQAVRANNFQVPLERLATFFDFATKRSIETGESVDYLVQSIIDGIGRKSTLVLDNLGISASQLQEEIKKTGDFGEAAANIISQSLEQTGVVADTTSIKLARLTAEWENFTKEVGDSLIVLGDFVLQMNDVNAAVSLSESALKDRVQSTASAAIATAKLSAATGEEIGLLKQVRIQLFGLTDEEEELIRIYEDSQKAKDKNNNSTKEAIGLTSANANSINQLNEELKTLKEQFNQAEIGGTDFYRLADEIEAKIKEINLALRLLAERRFASQPDEEISSFNITEIESQELTTDAIIDDYERRNNEIERLIEERNQLEKEKAEERAENERQTALAITEQTLTTISQLTATISQIQQNAFRREQEELQRQLEEGLITREEFERKELEIRRKAAQAQKDQALFQAVINTSQAIMQALANIPPPASYALAAVAGALGAAQIAAIASEPLPTFAEGGMVAEHGMLKGKSHKQGGILIEAEGEEYFMPKDKTRKHYGLLEAIRQGAEEQYILKNYVPKMIDESMFSGFADMGKSAELNGITANLKDHNLIAAIDRDRQSTSYGLNMVARKLDKLTNVNTRKGW